MFQMKISDGNVSKIIQSYIQQVENKRSSKSKSIDGKDSKTASAMQISDSVSISGRSDEVKKAKELYDELPEVRQELVDELKEKVRSGKYDVTSKEIADKIMHRAIVD